MNTIYDKKTVDKKVGLLLRDIRIRRGMTQQQLADALDFKSRSSINMIESGERGLDYRKLTLIANALSVQANDIVEEVMKDTSLDNVDEMALRIINQKPNDDKEEHSKTLSETNNEFSYHYSKEQRIKKVPPLVALANSYDAFSFNKDEIANIKNYIDFIISQKH